MNELNGCDGFGVGMELDRAKNLDENIIDELAGVTNQTVV